MATTAKGGGIYIEINGNPQPFEQVLRNVKAQASQVAGDISRTMGQGMSNADASRVMTGVTKAFAQLRVAAQGMGADLSAYQKHFADMGRQIGLTGQQAQAFSRTMQAAFQRTSEGNVLSALRSIQRQTGMTTAEVNKLARSLGVTGVSLRDRGGLGTMAGQLKSLAGSIPGVSLGVAGLVSGFVAFQKSALETSMQMERLQQAYKTIFSGGADSQLNFIYEQSKAVGQQFMQSAEAAKTFFAAAASTSLAPQMNEIYAAVSNAGAAMQLSGDQMQGVFLALGQMVSKGKVQAEELRGQLGERLPGAFQMAAEAMGMTTAELDKFMADGKLTAEDLLPKLAQVLQEKFAGAAEQAANTVQGTLNNLLNEWERFKNNLAASGPAMFIMRVVTEGLEGINTAQAQAARRDRAIQSLRERGVAPQGVEDVGLTEAWGLSSAQKVYSTEQWEAEAKRLEARDAAYAAHEGVVRQHAVDEEKALSEARKQLQTHQKAVDDLLKRTDNGRREALQKQKQSLQDYLNANDMTLSQEDMRRTQDAIREVDRQLSELGKKHGGGGAGAANRQFKFDTGLEQLRQEVANMEATLDPAAQGIERMRQKLELERQNAIAAAEAHAKLSIQRKEATPAEAEERKGLEIRKAELTYQQKLGEVEAKNRDVRVRFYEQLAQLSGNYTETIRLQTEALREQAREFEGAGIASDVVRQWQRLKELEMDRSPFGGMVRGLRQYASEATNVGQQIEGVVTQSFQGIEDAFVKMAQGAKVTFTDLANSIIADLMRITIRATITGPLAQGLLGLLGGGGKVQGIVGGVAKTIGGMSFSAKGNVFAGGTISDYANRVVSTPTYFNLGTRINAFARGAGVMGEAGAEAIMPLRRGADGRLGVEMYRDDAGKPSSGAVTVNIINSTGEQVTQQTRTDNYGNKTIDVMIGDAAAKQAAKPGSAMNRAIRGVTGVQTPVIRR